jgi:hypothetical protein
MLFIHELGACGSIVGWDTMLQAGRFNWPNPCSCAMAWGSTQPLTEMSIRNLPGGKGWSAHKTDNLTAIGSIVGWGTMLQAGRSWVQALMRWIFQLIWPFQPHYGPRVDSASNRNECQESSWGIKDGRRVRLTSLPPSMSLNISQPYEPPWPITEIALPFYYSWVMPINNSS